MRLQYICGNEVFASVPIDPAPVLMLAKTGLLIDFINQGVHNVTLGVAEEHTNLKFLDAINGVVYSGVLDQPDSLPLEDYEEENFSILCKWAKNGNTGGFLVMGSLESIEPVTQVLYDEETKLELDVKVEPDDQTNTALYPFFYKSSELGQGILQALEQQDAQKASQDFDAISTYIQLFKARIEHVKSVMPEHAELLEYYSALIDAQEYLEQMSDNLKGLA